MAYLPEPQERMRRETEAGLRERLAVAEAHIARLTTALVEEKTARKMFCDLACAASRGRYDAPWTMQQPAVWIAQAREEVAALAERAS